MCGAGMNCLQMGDAPDPTKAQGDKATDSGTAGDGESLR